MALHDLKGIHVLVVDDNEDSRELLRAAMEYCGAFVTAAASVVEASHLLHQFRPHVVVSDIGMPDDGVTNVREVTSLGGYRIPVIAITAFRGRGNELLDKGFVEVFEKPLDPMALCGAVLRHASAT